MNKFKVFLNIFIYVCDEEIYLIIIFGFIFFLDFKVLNVEKFFKDVLD